MSSLLDPDVASTHELILTGFQSCLTSVRSSIHTLNYSSRIIFSTMPPSSDVSYILAINCGSSSIKAKLFSSAEDGSLTAVAEASIKNIAAKREKVAISIKWIQEATGENFEEEGEDGDKVDCECDADAME